MTEDQNVGAENSAPEYEGAPVDLNARRAQQKFLCFGEPYVDKDTLDAGWKMSRNLELGHLAMFPGGGMAFLSRESWSELLAPEVGRTLLKLNVYGESLGDDLAWLNGCGEEFDVYLDEADHVCLMVQGPRFRDEVDVRSQTLARIATAIQERRYRSLRDRAFLGEQISSEFGGCFASGNAWTIRIDAVAASLEEIGIVVGDDVPWNDEFGNVGKGAAWVTRGLGNPMGNHSAGATVASLEAMDAQDALVARQEMLRRLYRVKGE